MAEYRNQQDFWPEQEVPNNAYSKFNFNMPEELSYDQGYQPVLSSNSFDTDQNSSYLNLKSDYVQGMSDFKYSESEDFDNEPPLLEELGINPNHIFQKTLSVLNPFRTTDYMILQDTDMAGPLVFVLTLGAILLFSGKVTFSYIYGIGVIGCIAIYGLLSLMATTSSVTFGAVISVLGYCLLPMVVLSGFHVLITIRGVIGIVFAGMSIIWCSASASKLFVTAYSMEHQQLLIAYPCALLYGIFALIIIF